MMPLLELLLLLAAFLCVFCIPGYACAIMVGCPRRILDLETFTFGALLGMAVVTVVTYFLSLLNGFGVPAILISPALVAGTAFTITSIKHRRWPVSQAEPRDTLRHAAKPLRLLWVVLIVVVCLVYFSQQIITVGNRTYFPEFARDFFVRTEIVNSILDTGIPPKNTFASVGPQPTMSYQYFFFLSCAMLSHLVSLPAIQTFPFMVAVSAGLFLLSSFLFVRRYTGSDEQAAFFLVIVFCAGLDLVMMVLRTLVLRTFYLHIDFWAGTPHVPILMQNLVWHPHHILALAYSLVVMLLLLDAGSWLSPANIVVALVLTALIGTSVNVGFVFAFGLIGLALWALYQERWSYLWQLISIGALTALIALPFLRELVVNSTQNQMLLGLRSVETIWGGAIFRFVLGANLLAQILDVLVHFTLEFGILLVLALLGLRQVLKQARNPILSVMLLSYAGMSLLVAVFVRSPYEAFALNGIAPFKIAVAIYSTVWVFRAFRERMLSKPVQVMLFLLLLVQFSASVYSISWDVGARVLPFGNKLEMAKQQYYDTQVIAEMDSLIQEPSYRLQVMPPWNNLGNRGINAHIPAFSNRAQVLYVADGALGLGMDRPVMEKYFCELCAMYGGDNEALAQELAAFDPTRAPQDAPWYHYITIVRKCFQGVTMLSEDAFMRFAHDYRIDYVLVEPDDTVFKSALDGLQAKDVVEIIGLKHGYSLLKIVQKETQ